MATPQQSPFSNEQYTVGWICALPIEMAAAKGMLDEEHGSPQTPTAEADQNAYLLGRIGHFNVVVACLPKDQVGSVSAAVAARDMLSTFPKVRFGLLVGIGAGIPNDEHDIRLGDVVISSDKASGGVVVYDFGKRLPDGSFESVSILNRPPRLLSSALVQLEAAHFTRENHISRYIDAMLGKYPYMRQRFRRPAHETDRLFRSDYLHAAGRTCKDCVASAEVQRESRLDEDSVIHYGTIATGDSVIKHALTRDRLGQKHNAICLEMEASGLMNNYPCIVIRGISDYADSHKNDHWHAYAAAAAAACAKELLQCVERKEVDSASAAKDILNEVREHVSEVRNVLVTEQVKKTLDWITTLDFSLEQKSIKKTPGTGSWFVHSPKFEQWLHGQSSTLFCPGIPGAGKTVMCSTVIDYLEARFQNDASIKVAFLFCSHQPRHDQSTPHLLLCLLRQLACREGMLSPHVQDLYRSNSTQASILLKKEDVSAALAATARSYEKVFIIIDGLDEYFPLKPEERETLLSEIFALQGYSAVNILVTSRFIPEIAHLFEGMPSLEIRASDADVLSYASSRIPALARGSISRYPEVQDVVKRHIVEKVDGMFLLARLHLDHLMGFPTVGQVEEALALLPSGENGLSEAYDQAMNRIKSQRQPCRQMAVEVLSWLTFSKRVLYKNELQHALATRINSRELEPKLIPTTETIGSLCAGLVVFQSPDAIVRLAHYTMKEYLTQSPLLRDAEACITRTCLAYLSLRDFSAGRCSGSAEYARRIDKYPLYDYGARYWGAHAAMALSVAPEVKEPVIRFLDNEALVSAANQGRLCPSRKEPTEEEEHVLEWNWPATIPLRVKGVHLTAYYGLDMIVSHYLDTGEDMEVEDSIGDTPLTYAVKGGQEETAKLLLASKHPSLSRRDAYGRTLLLRAAAEGKSSMARLFLTHGADINATDNSGFSALSYAAAVGDFGLTKILVDCGADVNVHCMNRGSPLLLASRSGNTEVVRLLLDHLADMDFANSDDGMALWAATDWGHDEIVKMLLERGVQSRPDNCNSMPIHCAAQWAHYQAPQTANYERIIELLLEAHADPNVRNSDHMTPLMIAADNGSFAAASNLLDHGADPNLQSNGLHTALFYASQGGHTDVVKLLLERGADPNLLDAAKQTAIFYAAGSGETEMLQHLIYHGAEVKIQNQYRQSPLTFAVQGGHLPATKLLIELGLDPGAPDIAGNTALFYAANTGPADIARLLLENGANLHHRNIFLETPLFWATRDPSTAALLLANGAEVNSRNVFNETPLVHIASMICYASLDPGTDNDWAHDVNAALELLVQYGASVDPICCPSDRIHGLFDLMESGADVPESLSPDELRDFRKLMGNELENLDVEGLKRLMEHVSHSQLAGLFTWQRRDWQRGQATPLLWAAEAGCTRLVELFLEHGARADIQDRFQRTAIIVAAEHGHAPVVELLLDARIHPQPTECDLRRILSSAAQNKRGDVVQLILPRTTLPPNVGDSAMISASGNGDVDSVRQLLDSGYGAQARDQDGQTAYHHAATQGAHAIIRLLLDRGILFHDEKDDHGRTPLFWAVQHDRFSAAKVLLEAGADPNVAESGGTSPILFSTMRGVKNTRLKARDQLGEPGGQTPLFFATINGHDGMVQLLLDHGADPNFADKYGETPLCWAAGQGFETIVRILLNHNACPQPLGTSSQAPLGWAVLCRPEKDVGGTFFSIGSRGRSSRLPRTIDGDFETVARLLLDRGADPNFRSRDNPPTLIIAVLCGSISLVRLLLERGSDANAPWDSGQTPLYIAVEKGSAELVTILFENHANPNLGTVYGRTPLMLAVVLGHWRCVATLLKVETIDRDAIDKFGRSALSEAHSRGLPIIRRLLSNEGDVGLDTCDDLVHPATSKLVAKSDSCHICDIPISYGDLHWSCNICLDGSFNICQDCKSHGGQCLNLGHDLILHSVNQ